MKITVKDNTVSIKSDNLYFESIDNGESVTQGMQTTIKGDHGGLEMLCKIAAFSVRELHKKIEASEKHF